jgi:hypothetical protein
MKLYNDLEKKYKKVLELYENFEKEAKKQITNIQEERDKEENRANINKVLAISGWSSTLIGILIIVAIIIL